MADEPDSFKAEVLTPEGPLFEGDLFHLSARTVVGEVGVRARHAPMLARLVPAELRLYDSESAFNQGGSERYVAAEGWLEVFGNRVVVLIGEAIAPDRLDRSSLEERLRDAEQRLDEAEEDSAAHETAERDRARAEAFLELAR